MGCIKLLYYLPVFFIAFTTCGSEKTAQKVLKKEVAQIEINRAYSNQTRYPANLLGQIENFQGRITLSKISPRKMEILDTFRLKNQTKKFSFSVPFEEPTLCYLTFGKNNQGIPILLSKEEKVNMKIKYGQIPEAEVQGGEENIKLAELFTIYSRYDRQMLIFNKEVSKLNMNALADSTKRNLQLRYQNIQSSRTQSISEFMTKEAGTLASYFAATYLFEDTPLSMLNEVYRQMKIKHSNSSYTQQLANRIESASPLQVGAYAPEIELPTPQGEILKLSSLKGQIVLIDFWASWCRPCRAENPKVKLVYEKYKDKGFEIYGVSLDNNKNKWMAAIKQDGLPWKHVSDLGGWQNIAAQKYKINSIPNTYLIDKDGKILAIGLRAHQLDKFLEKIL